MTDNPSTAPVQSPPAPVAAMVAAVMLCTAVGIGTVVTATALFRGAPAAEFGPTWPVWLRIGAEGLAFVALAGGRRRLTVAASVLLVGSIVADTVHALLTNPALGPGVSLVSILEDKLTAGVTVVALAQLGCTGGYWVRRPARGRWWGWMIGIALPSMVVQFAAMVVGGLLLSAPDLRVYSPAVRLAGPLATAWLYVLYTRRVPRHVRASAVGVVLAAQVPAIAVEAYQLGDGTHTPATAVIVSCGPWAVITLTLLVTGLRGARRAAAQSDAE